MNKTLKYIVLLTFACFVGKGYAQELKSEVFSLLNLASDAFFPFPDCVEIADKEGVKAVIQPGGSVKDELTFQYCNEHGVAMVVTGIRHFKH